MQGIKCYMSRNYKAWLSAFCVIHRSQNAASHRAQLRLCLFSGKDLQFVKLGANLEKLSLQVRYKKSSQSTKDTFNLLTDQN